MQSKAVQLLMRKSKVFFYMCILCHWFACGMKLVDSEGEAGWLSSYRDVGNSLSGEYFTAIYWAMTTLTTVGYGDIVPTTAAERGFTTCAMMVGGSFYGYVVGAITSVVSNSDLNSSAYYERMDLIYAWLNHHRLPVELARTLRKYFKSYLAEKTAINEAQVFADLSHELQREVGAYLINENVTNNPLFDGIGISSAVQLQSILKRATIQAHCYVVRGGEIGTTMYVLVSGSLSMEAFEYQSEASQEPGSPELKGQSAFSGMFGSSKSDGSMKTASHTSLENDAKRRSRSGKGRQMVPGQCFGEEILLGFEEYYDYTVKSMETSKVEMIQQKDLLNVFQLQPNILERMRKNARAMNPEWELKEQQKAEAAAGQMRPQTSSS